MLKLDAGEVAYEKYEPLTLEAYHESRRRWIMKFEDQATFDDWAKMLTKCAKMCKSGTLEEPVAIAAFDDAFLETKRNCWPWTYRSYGGSESDQLIALVWYLPPSLSPPPSSFWYFECIAHALAFSLRSTVAAGSSGLLSFPARAP